MRTPTRQRPIWPALPVEVRAAVEQRLGAPVTDWRSHDGGYSPGPALTLATADGARLFLKGADGALNADGLAFARREAWVCERLPREVPAPRLLWTVELTTDRGEAWRLLAFDAVVGHPPHVPWRADERDAVGNLVERLARVTAPPGLPGAAEHIELAHWRALLRDSAGLETYGDWAVRRLPWLAAREAGWAEAVRGDTLVHNDLRGDNVLLTADGAGVVVDWPHAVRGAPFLDLVGWLPSLALEGGGAPQEVFDRHPVGRAADPEAVTTFLVALTGYFVHSSLQPPPPGIPHVRAFQRAQGEVCVAWLRTRLGE